MIPMLLLICNKNFLSYDNLSFNQNAVKIFFLALTTSDVYVSATITMLIVLN